jgi:hypothetical protein
MTLLPIIRQNIIQNYVTDTLDYSARLPVPRLLSIMANATDSLIAYNSE